jgi:lysophospholipase L1-like esterase
MTHHRGRLPAKLVLVTALASLLLSSQTTAETARVALVKVTPSSLRLLTMSTGGRMLAEQSTGGASSYNYQWPGVYFEAAFNGNGVYFKVGPGETILHVVIDDQPPIPLIKPAAGFYKVDRLANGTHNIRIEVVTESQAAPATFGGFALPMQSTALSTPKRERQIEFIGDSYTVGYGNLSPKRDCTQDEVWATTDNSQAFGPLTARHYDADYQINAISGRGIVRNYDGGRGDPVPVAYPFVRFDKQTVYADKTWRPQIIVIGLGTNDFSTPLHSGEQWRSRDELHADYEANYVRFVKSLRARNPAAFVILMATDAANGEIQSEVMKVVAQLKAAGEDRIAFVPMNGLTMTGCDYHLSTADDRTVSQSLIRFIDANPRLWPVRSEPCPHPRTTQHR